jgi:hypothetical protein
MLFPDLETYDNGADIYPHLLLLRRELDDLAALSLALPVDELPQFIADLDAVYRRYYTAHYTPPPHLRDCGEREPEDTAARILQEQARERED